ncbi:PspA/IM30 family protein [Arthrobacter sp. TMN-37]
MSLPRRISRIIRANKAAAQPVEDPLVVAANAQRAQHAALDQARRGAADVAAHRRRLEILTGDAAARVRHLEAQAAAAVARGDDDAAREALRAQLGAAKHLQALGGQLQETDVQARRLAADVARLEERMSDSWLRHQALLAQQAAAEASVRAQEALRSSAGPIGGGEFAAREAEREVRRLQALAAAREELAWSDPSSQRVQEAFEELEADAAARQELARLKEQRARGYRPGPQ